MHKIITKQAKDPFLASYMLKYFHVVRYTGVVAYKSGPMRIDRELVYRGCVNPSLLGYLIPGCGAHLFEGFSSYRPLCQCNDNNSRRPAIPSPSPAGLFDFVCGS